MKLRHIVVFVAVVALLGFALPCAQAERISRTSTLTIPSGGGTATMVESVKIVGIGTGSKEAGIHTLGITWNSSSAGNVTATIPAIDGVLMRVTFDPSASAAPSASYDIVVNDVDSFDVLRGAGANLSATVTTSPGIFATDASYGYPMPINGALTLAVTNAGNAKTGLIRLYIRRE